MTFFFILFSLFYIIIIFFLSLFIASFASTLELFINNLDDKSDRRVIAIYIDYSLLFSIEHIYQRSYVYNLVKVIILTSPRVSTFDSTSSISIFASTSIISSIFFTTLYSFSSSSTSSFSSSFY